jgi:hypothetical protein
MKFMTQFFMLDNLSQWAEVHADDRGNAPGTARAM